jgi:hypothetical protein
MMKLQTRIGLYNKNFQMADPPVHTEEAIVEVVAGRKWPARFVIKMGNMVFNGQTYDKTYVLEIEYEGSYNAHSERLGAYSFGAHLYADFAELAHEMALRVCSQRGLVMSKHLNSWPKFQAIVFAS